MATHQILFYDYVEGIAQKRAPHRDAHLAHIKAAKDAGDVVMAGAIGDPPRGGVIVFGDVEREVIERFATTDPYVEAGLVTDRRIEPWNVV